jgi:hypothetical protein
MAVVATGMAAAANQTMAAERHRAASDHQRLRAEVAEGGGGEATDEAARDAGSFVDSPRTFTSARTARR